MLVSVLASGSKGNSTLIKTDKLNILIDAGMNMKYIKEKLEELDTRMEDINYIFLTHTHKDHVGALSTIVRHYNPTICMGSKMFMDLEYLENYNDILILVDDLTLEDVKIEPCKTLAGVASPNQPTGAPKVSELSPPTINSLLGS